MSDYIINYRDHFVGQKFSIHGADISEPLGFLLKGMEGLRLKLERVEFMGRLADTSDNNDIANIQLVTTDKNGNPATPILDVTASAIGTTTTIETGLTMVLNEHAGRWAYARSGANAGEARLISANTVGGQITHAAFSNATAEDDVFSILAAAPGDALWDGKVEPITPGWRCQNDGGDQTVPLHHKYDNLILPPNKGIGFFAMVEDDFTGVFDYVQWTECQIDIHGQVLAAGGASTSHATQLQPSGSV